MLQESDGYCNPEELVGLPDHPNDIYIEQALLGAILVDNGSYDRVADLVGSEHFFEGLHSRIWDVAASLIIKGQVADPISLRPYFQNVDRISDNLTVPQYLARLAASAASLINARSYAEQVVFLAQRRVMQGIGRRMVVEAGELSDEISPAQLVEEYLTELGDIGETASRPDSRSMVSVVRDLTQEVADAHAAGGRDFGIRLPLRALQDLLGGLAPGDVYTIAARPGMGKTALLMDILGGIGKTGVRSALFSMEMQAEQIAYREMSKFSNINMRRLREARDLTDRDVRNLRDGIDYFERLPIQIDETGGLTLERLAARARRMKRRHGIELFALDYLQLMAGTKPGGRVQELSHITSGIKSLSKELNVPFIVLSQLSRNVEQRENKRPQLSDLRDSGSIEQDSDAVIFIYREAYYLEREAPDESKYDAFADWQEKLSKCDNTAEILVQKVRQGKTGICKVHWDGARTKFSDLERRTDA